jgi:hypothetical protein
MDIPHRRAMSTPAGHHADRTPSPVTAAALFVLGAIRIERVPWWAAQWLADGHDGEALRELAGLDGRDPHAVTDLIPSALAEAARRSRAPKAAPGSA